MVTGCATTSATVGEPAASPVGASEDLAAGEDVSDSDAVGGEAAAPHTPLLYDGYGVELPADGDGLYVEKLFTFVGPVVRVRVRYLDAPEGSIERSTYRSCEVELEAPITWTEAGFDVAATVTATATAGNFERTELEPEPGGARRADNRKDVKSCWVTLLEGRYRVESRSEATIKGRPKQVRIVEPDGKVRELRALGAPEDEDFYDLVNDHFWQR